ncbi:MAG: TetR/AcrR family transcriptional regulator [Bacteriovorax sp.]|nr:TetR/AcrR family transcriptional regulator [Rhizobacter sp.]
MKPVPDISLAPRRTPRQARSAVTVNAIYEATVQVLLAEGQSRLTTTRVAERAGVSVGTMYQYFPNKRSLLFAVLQQHLGVMAEAVEAAAQRYDAQPIAVMADGLVRAYVDAKTRNVEVAEALYRIAGELDTAAMIATITKRIHKAISTLLASASDVTFDNLREVTFTLSATMAGACRAVFERGATPAVVRILRSELPVMCTAYLLVRATR